MNEIVFLKQDDVFTDSLVIAEQTGNQHSSVTRLIRKNRETFENMGTIKFMDFKSKNPKGGRPAKVYMLNEMQATFLITLLDNTPKVIAFKAELVSQFYKMRQFILERHTIEWQETRKQGKLTRKAETDVIKQLVEYAKNQGSTHSEMLYMTYSKLANSLSGIKSCDEATVSQLNNLSIFENIILQMICNGIEEGLNYKQIYQICKSRCNDAKQIAMI